MSLVLRGNIADPGRALTAQELIGWGGECPNIDDVAREVEDFLNGNTPRPAAQNQPMRKKLSREPPIDYGQNTRSAMRLPHKSEIDFGERRTLPRHPATPDYRRIKSEAQHEPQIDYGQGNVQHNTLK